MLKIAIATAVILLLSLSPLIGQTASNQQFCAFALSEVVDSIILGLKLPPQSSITLLPIQGAYGDLLHDELADRMHERGMTVYLADSPSDEGDALEASLDRFELLYLGHGAGLFSRGKVERVCAISASARLLGERGRLLASSTIPAYRTSELLNFEAAEMARTGEGLYAPKMPPSIYQRVVEPALIIGITGALVYLFFASR